ncbi:MAG: hypothetical protein AAGG75_27625 [Bacteroidota bacterium]
MMNIITILLVGVFLLLLLTVHELGHIVSAKLLQMPIKKVGFTTVPFPHVFVSVNWPREKNKRTLYLMSGFATTLSIFAIVLLFGVDFKPLLIALCIQMIIETNPIYSDFIIINMFDKVSSEVRSTRQPYKAVYKKVYNKYLFSPKWYIHFAIWFVLIITFINVIKNIYV